MIKILKVNKNGTGWEAGLREGDRIISINNDIINDQLDYKYWPVYYDRELKTQKMQE